MVLPEWTVNSCVTAGVGRARGKGSVFARSFAGGGQQKIDRRLQYFALVSGGEADILK